MSDIVSGTEAASAIQVKSPAFMELILLLEERESEHHTYIRYIMCQTMMNALYDYMPVRMAAIYIIF